MILDLCSEGTWTATSPHDTAKGIAYETRSDIVAMKLEWAVQFLAMFYTNIHS